jgi:hypothetical protein
LHGRVKSIRFSVSKIREETIFMDAEDLVKEFAFSGMLKRMGKGLYVYCVEALGKALKEVE